MTARRAAFAVAFAITIWSIAFARFASAAEPSEPRLRVLIVIDSSDDPFAERIKAEVSALGFEVVAVEPWRTGETVESLDAAGRANQAAAAIRMIASRKGVEVWMAAQPTGRSLLRQLVVDERPGPPNQGLVALQTAELLRTTLLSRSEVPATAAPAAAPRGTQANGPPQAETVAPPSPATPASSASSASPASPASPPSTSVQAAAGVLASPGGGGAAMQVWVTVSRALVGPFALALDLSAPLRPGTVSGPEGSANVSPWLAGAAMSVRYDRPATGLYVIAAAGGAAIRISSQGNATYPFTASSESTTAGAVYVRADGGFEATRALRLGLRAVVGAVPSGVQVRFAGNEAAVWGRPFLGALLLADLSF